MARERPRHAENGSQRAFLLPERPTRLSPYRGCRPSPLWRHSFMSFSVYNVRKRSPRGVLCLFQGILDLKRDAFSSPGDAPFRGNRFNSTRKLFKLFRFYPEPGTVPPESFQPSLSLSLFSFVSFRCFAVHIPAFVCADPWKILIRALVIVAASSNRTRFRDFLDEFVRGVQC